MKITPICEIQGTGLWSPLVDKVVTVKAVVTGSVRRGFFIQNPDESPDPLISDALFVYSPKWRATNGVMLQVTGKVVDYVKEENGKPVTQIKFKHVEFVRGKAPVIEPFELTAENLPSDPRQQAVFLNSLESMLVSIAAGQTFISPSNPFGDYVVILDTQQSPVGITRTEHGGALIDHNNPLRWYPGFRITRYDRAPRLNVGAKLKSRIVGPLNYRVEAYQIALNHGIDIEPRAISLQSSQLRPESGYLTILTLNGFNLDVKVESQALVVNPRKDVDDDRGDGRFHSLAEAVVSQANLPDVIALQEIQDNDGAEITEIVDAELTYLALIKIIKRLSNVSYRWVDISPEVGADGGQPGGNIRNGYLYNPERVELVKGSVRLIGVEEEAFIDSRKPLVVHFKEKTSAKELACINVHLASKRHQHSIFAPEKASYDPKLSVRIEQAEILKKELIKLQQQGLEYYLTGDFNDTEVSEPLAVLVADDAVNLVNSLPVEHRYDYNHRGKLQVLMHGIVSKQLAAHGAEYEIVHGNELLGVQPGNLGDKPTDHAYVIAKLKMG